jgi:hypothetical protein
MTQRDLKNFIKEYILPSKQISYNQFLSLVWEQKKRGVINWKAIY